MEICFSTNFPCLQLVSAPTSHAYTSFSFFFPPFCFFRPLISCLREIVLWKMIFQINHLSLIRNLLMRIPPLRTFAFLTSSLIVFFWNVLPPIKGPTCIVRVLEIVLICFCLNWLWFMALPELCWREYRIGEWERVWESWKQSFGDLMFSSYMDMVVLVWI